MILSSSVSDTRHHFILVESMIGLVDSRKFNFDFSGFITHDENRSADTEEFSF